MWGLRSVWLRWSGRLVRLRWLGWLRWQIRLEMVQPGVVVGVGREQLREGALPHGDTAVPCHGHGFLLLVRQMQFVEYGREHRGEAQGGRVLVGP